MVKVQLAEHLDAAWNDVVNRELDLSLLRLDQQRFSINLSLKRLTASNQKHTGFLCEVAIYDSGERICDFAIDHNDGRFAIRQALARTRRTVARREGRSGNSAALNRKGSVVPLR